MKQRRLYISVLLLALVNMIPAIEVEKSWGLLAIAVFSALLSCNFTIWRPARRIARWALLAGVLGAVGYLVFEMFAPQEETTVHIVDLSHFLVLLCCCKFFELRSDRDAGVIAMISLLLLVTSAFVSASLWFAVALAIDMTFGLAWMMAYHIRREAGAVEATQRAAAGGSAHETSADRKAEPARLAVLTAGCAAVVLVTIAVVFVFMPRDWGLGIFGQIHRLVPAVTGFAEVVQLTDQDVQEDDTPVMRVRFSENNRTLDDAEINPYLRGLSFHRYFDAGWRRFPTVDPKEYAVLGGESPTALFPSTPRLLSERCIRQEVWLDAPTGGVVFAAFPPLAVASPDFGRVQMDHRDWSLRAPVHSGKTRYTVYSPASLGPEAAQLLPMRPMSQHEGWSKIPNRVRQLAAGLGAEAGNPDNPLDHERIAHHIERHLAEGEFGYTLSRKDGMTSDEPVVDFLFSSKKGHCTYFATAMTLLCQSLNIQSRFVSGYHGGEFNDAGGFFQFRKSDAHAWVEVFLPNRGWVTFDPTPASAAGRRLRDNSLLARVRRLFNYLQFQWSTAVVSFDAETRQALARSVRAWLGAVLQSGETPKSLTASIKALAWGPEYFSTPQRILYWFILLLWAAFVAAALRVVWILSVMLRAWLPRRIRTSTALIRRGEARFYEQLLSLLARKGHARPAHETPREFALALAEAHPHLADLPLYTEWYYEVQFGGRPLGKARHTRLKTFLQALREDPAFGSRHST